MVVLSLAQDAIVLVLFYFVECDKSIAAFALQRLCEDPILVIMTERVHENVRLGRSHMHSTLAVLDLATLDL